MCHREPEVLDLDTVSKISMYKLFVRATSATPWRPLGEIMVEDSSTVEAALKERRSVLRDAASQRALPTRLGLQSLVQPTRRMNEPRSFWNWVHMYRAQALVASAPPNWYSESWPLCMFYMRFDTHTRSISSNHRGAVRELSLNCWQCMMSMYRRSAGWLMLKDSIAVFLRAVKWSRLLSKRTVPTLGTHVS